MKPFLFLILGLSFASGVYGQTVAEGRLLDADTKEPLLFGSVGIAHSDRGTISNEEGYFRLETAPGDTLLFSFVGYHPTRMAASAFPADRLVYLKNRGVSLKTATIVAPDFLYTLLGRCKQAPAAPAYTAKTYLELNASIGGQPIERLEMYYNGQYSGTHIDELQFKNGRIFLASFWNGFFLNLETSKAVSMLRILGTNAYFPDHPFHLSKPNLRNAYQVRLADMYRDTGTVYVVEFVPRASDGTRFAGQVWVDSASNRIQKLNLHVNDARPHPFKPQWPQDTLVRVDMDLTYTFKNRNGAYVFDVVNCTYQVVYKGRGGIRPVQVQCMLRAYDYENTFILPFYTYNTDFSDYRKITMMPHNAFFWQHRDSLVATEKQALNRSFFLDRGVSFNYPDSWKNAKKSFFESNALVWTGSLRLNLPEFTDTSAVHPIGIPADQYKLKVQLYMDINPHGDSLHVFTATLYDVFNSYYRLPLDSMTNCFVNIYFDLYEMQRRELDKDLRKPGLTVEAMAELHRQHTEKVNLLARRYLREVERGQNRPAMERWNQYVLQGLGIDNLSLFNPGQSSKFR